MADNIVGTIKNIKEFISKKGQKFAFATLVNNEDEIDLVFFANAWENNNCKIENNKETTLIGKFEYQEMKNQRCFIVDSIFVNVNFPHPLKIRGGAYTVNFSVFSLGLNSRGAVYSNRRKGSFRQLVQK